MRTESTNPTMLNSPFRCGPYESTAPGSRFSLSVCMKERKIFTLIATIASTEQGGRAMITYVRAHACYVQAGTAYHQVNISMRTCLEAQLSAEVGLETHKDWRLGDVGDLQPVGRSEAIPRRISIRYCSIYPRIPKHFQRASVLAGIAYMGHNISNSHTFSALSHCSGPLCPAQSYCAPSL